MSEELCKCGHLRVYHLTDRGRCTDSHRVLFFTPPIVDPRHTVVPPEQRQAAIAKLPRRLQERVAKRGWITLECTCPMFHLVELGKVKLAGPSELISELAKMEKRQ